jgi:triosephosphate isomerase
MMRKPFVAGNWKMNTDSHGAVKLAEGIVSGCRDLLDESIDVAVCPPFV